mmetsp:Transcript_5329/g.12607  ORF Transcript_5329/g.12607 Transcript_5329/m.12607 type:complete len:224 (-) Transcript_5329:1022-1693(-)
MTHFEWLRRCCMEKHYFAFEDANYKDARAIYTLNEGSVKDELGIKDPLELNVIKTLATTSDDPDTLLSFTSVDRIRIQSDFIAKFHGRLVEAELGALAVQLANKLTNDLGMATHVSKAMLAAHLARHAEAGPAACVAAVDELTTASPPERVPKPTPPEPTEWVFGWLRSHGLEEYAPGLIGAKMCDKRDFVSTPPITLEDLDKLGVKALGDARKLFNMIQDLQ